MRSTHKVEQMIRDIHVRPNADQQNKTLEDLVEAHSDYRRTRRNLAPGNLAVGPLIKKLAIAAVFIAALAGIALFNLSPPPCLRH